VFHRDLKLENIFVHFKNFKTEEVFGFPDNIEEKKKKANLNEEINVVIGDLGFAIEVGPD